jgi:long-chain acyl-CoA synthetase
MRPNVTVPLAALDAIQTLPALLRWRVRETPSSPAYREFDTGAAGWRTCTWSELDREVDRWRRALAAERLEKSARVAILMPNGIAHIAMDQAALSCGLVPVPLHAIDNPESIVYILQDVGAAILLVDSIERWQEIAKIAGREVKLKRIICASSGAKTGDSRVVALDHWLASAPAAANTTDVAAGPHDLAAIVYTSGTVGRPKGVMLSHDNILSNLRAIARRLPITPDFVFLSFLPLSHTFERTCGYYYPMAMGACVAYSRSIKQLADDLKEVRPTVLVSVPRIYERIYAKIMEHRTTLGRLERAVFDLTLAVGGRRLDARRGHGSVPLLDQILWPVLRRAVAAKVLAEFGGRLQFALSGGAPIGEPVIRLFLSLGLEVLQGYGMTELSPVVSVNSAEDNYEYLSVGRPLDGIDVKLADNGELLVKGPNVMLGYWGKPEETRRAKQADGWLHTGDQARIEDGRIFITGRIKDILVTSTGEKIAPADLETAILADPLFEQVMVIGEKRPYLAVLAVLNAHAWDREKSRLHNTNRVSAQDASRVEATFLLGRIAAAVKAYPAYATPHAVWWSTDPWTIDAGLLTPTLKTKRAAIEQRFAAEIEKLYAARQQQPSVRQPAAMSA